MSSGPTEHSTRPPPACRRCREPMERGWNACRACGHPVAAWWHLRAEGNHTLAMCVAVVSFLIAHGWMLESTVDHPLKTSSMLARLIVLGMPLAVVAWNWFLLCRSEEPDYGYLWRTYCLAQWAVILLAWIPVSVGRWLGWF